MSLKLRILSGAALVAAIILTMTTCGRDQQLVSISIAPSTETFGSSTTPVPADAGLNVQLVATGTYIHPPVTKDVTSQVTWVSNTPGLATVNSTGLLTATGQDCGTGLVTATITKNSSDGGISSSGAIVSGTMTVNVVCDTGSASSPTLTITFMGTGTGTVTSTPAGLICTSTCTASFASGTPVTLSANATGTFGGWSGCDTMTGETCVINSLTTDRAVTVTFN
jgi:hypothetical protein